MTVLDWLKGITRYNFEDTTFQTIALGRSVDIDDDISNLNTENKELLTADIIFTAVVLSPSNTASRSSSHGGFQMSNGSETDQNQFLKIKYAKSIYRKYNDSKLDLLMEVYPEVTRISLDDVDLVC